MCGINVSYGKHGGSTARKTNAGMKHWKELMKTTYLEGVEMQSYFKRNDQCIGSTLANLSVVDCLS